MTVDTLLQNRGNDETTDKYVGSCDKKVEKRRATQQEISLKNLKIQFLLNATKYTI